MKLDKVLTIAIGRNDANGEPLSGAQWLDFCSRLDEIVAAHGTIVFAGSSDYAIGSDGANDGEQEESYALIAINPEDVRGLREDIASLLWVNRQTSAAFALDSTHEPVWYTIGGDRPAISPAPVPVTAREYAPAHGGYCE